MGEQLLCGRGQGSEFRSGQSGAQGKPHPECSLGAPTASMEEIFPSDPPVWSHQVSCQSGQKASPPQLSDVGRKVVEKGRAVLIQLHGCGHGPVPGF